MLNGVASSQELGSTFKLGYKVVWHSYFSKLYILLLHFVARAMKYGNGKNKNGENIWFCYTAMQGRNCTLTKKNTIEMGLL